MWRSVSTPVTECGRQFRPVGRRESGGASVEEGQLGLNTVENYNITTNRWATKADMPVGAGAINGVGEINGEAE